MLPLIQNAKETTLEIFSDITFLF